TLKSHLSDLAAGLAARQDATTGCWYQLLDEDGTFHTSTYNNGENHSDTYNYIESSASALFTAGYLKAMRLGYLSGSTVPTGCSKNYETIAKDGYKGLVNNFFAIDGNEGVHIFGSCRSAGLGNKNSSAGSSNYRDGSKAYYLLGGDVTREAKASNITNRVTEGKALGGFILAATEYERAYQNNMVLFEKDLAPTYSLTAGDQITCPASGSGESISYKWYKVVNESPVEVATGATFTPEESGEYYCTATSGNTITSSHTQVTVSGEAPAETTYTVTFNATTNGGSCATASLTQASSGASITLPTATKSGYTFNGWYTASTGGTLRGAANASYTPTANETLYAQFTENSGTEGATESITWSGSSLTGVNGTNVTAGTSTAVNGSTYKAGTISINSNKIQTESKKHTDDSYWEDFSNGTQSASSTNATSTARIEFPITVADGYTFNVSEVDFKLEQGGGDGPAVHVFLVQGSTSTWLGYTTAATIAWNNLNIDLEAGSAKLVFVLGVNTNLNNGRAFKFSNIAIKGTSDQTGGSPTTYTVSYNMNGHGEAIADVTDVTALPNPLPSPTASGYIFGGWYIDSGLSTAAT
ncbi:MAG: InlB B-repeat-containing protein, partial [Lachnospiraceae bacterium]|nr:InlB B-repeat-containing protein [Lachnospiraceae bacterium]